MAGCNDDAAVGLFANHCKFCGRRSSHSDIDHVSSAADQCAAHEVFHHAAGDAGVAAHHHSGLFALFGKAFDVCCSEFNYIYGGQGIAAAATDGAANAGN